MREQRTALRVVREAARTLCASAVRARERMSALIQEKMALERAHAVIVGDRAPGRETPPQASRDDADGQHVPRAAADRESAE